MTPHMKNSPMWWKESSVYQIYPASFKDSTGNGTGDLQGIISKVDYLKDLGVDIVWLSPIFKSPQVDMGYDVSDYKTIDPPYGNIDDVLTLRDKLHERGMKLILDLVVNHTSDQHEWFKQAIGSKNSPYRDYYIWRDPKYSEDGTRQPPNNWVSHFQGPAWRYDEASDQYYLHLFCPEQPDLNWENPAVRNAVHDVIRFWLDRGIDGFRMDVINFISKPSGLPDSTSAEVPRGCDLYSAGPKLHTYLKEIGDILREYNAFSVGEMPCVSDTAEIIKSVAAERGELSMIFHFDFVTMDYGIDGKFAPRDWSLLDFKALINKWQRFMFDNDGWNALYLENHDQPRGVSRFVQSTPDNQFAASKMLAVLQLLQAGTPFIYQGQEIGMSNVPPEWPMEEYKDVDCLNHWDLHKDSCPETKALLRSQYLAKSRDNARTPMQWDVTPNAGFSPADATSPPWMRVNPNYTRVNAASQVSDPSSPYAFWASVLRLRKQHKETFVYGDFAPVDEENPDVLAFIRTSSAGARALVVCSFSPSTITWESTLNTVEEVLLSSYGQSLEHFKNGTIRLGPYETAVLLLKQDA
ncbi:alpha amylase [Ceratocystis lukuohia]|uniref:Alpha amylase n=1 Tax=Ceratocystis lukuohia TaxID=2019550 RepID=A0ABR4MNB6_9PEZI